MIQEGIQYGTITPPTRGDISIWAQSAMEALPKQIVKNAWRHGEFTWLPEESSSTTNSNIIE
jgi:hypothetical protein